MKSKIILSPQVARYLVKNGCTIIDIKPDRNNLIKTCFVFDCDEKFVNLLEKWTQNTQKKEI